MRFEVKDIKEFEQKALIWASSFDTSCYLNGNNISTYYPGFPQMLAAGVKDSITGNRKEDLVLLEKITASRSYYFGYFSYDIKNWLENLSSSKPDTLKFPGFWFFRPLHLIHFSENSVEIESDRPETVFGQINALQPLETQPAALPEFTPETSEAEYISKVNSIRNNILEGDVYELNYCIRFSAVSPGTDCLPLYLKINTDSPAPFSCFFNTPSHSVISASPERFLRKDGDKIISQPMKGTIRRGNSEEEDALLKQKLRQSEKEQAENMMIVDLVRNDLAKSAQTGSVNVEQIFGVYSFKYVHQMISTVSASQSQDKSAAETILNAFPMGSMTGAPKIKAMELIDLYENSSRGAFSGAAGYFDPAGNFDFNVLIRSVFYNKNTGEMSVSAGSAITYDSDPAKEYEECLLKAGSLFRALKK